MAFMTPTVNLHFEALGDQAILIQAANEADALAVATAVREQRYGWTEDIVQAYSSIAVFYRPDAMDYRQATDCLAALDWRGPRNAAAGKLHFIPCCYDLGLDFDRIAQHSGLSREQVVAIHSETIYTVYAIGFCPGFPYLGYLPPSLAGVPRLESPRVKVEAGSVGLTGRQTGIYTEARPGGWNIVGRTPLELVNVVDGYFPIRTGDRVQFQPIDDAAFRELSGQRLPT